MKRIFLIVTIGFAFVLFGCKTTKNVEQVTEDSKSVAEQIEEAESKSISDYQDLEIEELEVELSDEVFVKSNVKNKIDSIRFERTSCYGTCPTFVATFYANGTMKYLGKVFVEHVGTFSASINKDYFLEVEESMSNNGFFEMKDSYDAQMTDIPSVITEVWYGDSYKKVFNKEGAPAELRTIEKQLDFIIAKATNWVKVAD